MKTELIVKIAKDLLGIEKEEALTMLSEIDKNLDFLYEKVNEQMKDKVKEQADKKESDI